METRQRTTRSCSVIVEIRVPGKKKEKERNTYNKSSKDHRAKQQLLMRFSTACAQALWAKEDTMPEDRNCKLLHSSRSSDKKTKKKRKKATASATPPENTDKPQVVSLPPETLPRPPQLPKLRGTSKKDAERLSGCGRRSKKDNPKDSSSPLIATNKNTAHGAPVQGYVDELSAQARESLRWQGELEDPQAEEKRLELYRANRRQRYISHKEALLKETQYALKQTFPKESKEIKALTGCDQQEQRLN